MSKLKPNTIGIYTIAETPAHMLRAERIKSQWWIELIDRASGHVRIVYFNRKDQALAMFDGMTMTEVIKAYDEMGVSEAPMYKAGVI